MTSDRHCPWLFYKLSKGKIMYFISEKIDEQTCFITYVGRDADVETLKEFY
ncbi:hypothetical protein IR114_03095 [Granulicatella sp. 19428wC4_WM01]|uniref:hypothetical protein n=1 Tax=Granulicatella sp. WM01 TaxID=2558277 RepID=UPI00142F89C4|nr:hypothetical protein [Granulicatella sp. WM01]MBF0780070.1 hypothetical protein [Granulicatella sp. 19428wC4_WM01]